MMRTKRGHRRERGLRFADSISGDEAAAFGLIRLELQLDNLLSEKALVNVLSQIRNHGGWSDEPFRV
jgi:hypothetical protein